MCSHLWKLQPTRGTGGSLTGGSPGGYIRGHYMSIRNLEAVPDPRPFPYPDEEPETESNEYREASRRFLQIISTALETVTCSTSPALSAWAASYALGLPHCEGVSITNRAGQLGVTPQALSKQVKSLTNILDVQDSQYCYQSHN